jgi:nitrous oxidase accessory protein NosD
VFLKASATVSTPHTVSNNFSSALISHCSQGLHLTASEEMTKIKGSSFLETGSFDP